MNKIPEPCLCGDRLCELCFPNYDDTSDPDQYDKDKQAEIDDRLARQVTDELIKLLPGLGANDVK